MLLEESIARLEMLGVTVRFVSLGGSVLLGCLGVVTRFKERTGVQIVLRVGESIVAGTVPGVPVGQDDLALVSGVSVRLPALRRKETDTYLVAGGYPALEPSGINALDCVIVRQWSEQAIMHCSPERVHNGTIEVPLIYSGAARLKVHRDAVVVPVP